MKFGGGCVYNPAREESKNEDNSVVDAKVSDGSMAPVLMCYEKKLVHALVSLDSSFILLYLSC